jgi:NRAMP (natural resistance-associated macrophage protein)-like metal ion transporter
MTMAANVRGLFRRRRLQLVIFLGILGPGLITSTADNDAGGIFTYAQAGAKYGYDLIWLLAVTTVALAVVQEINARLGVVTGKGLADLIRERFGVANAATVMADFAGVALAGEAFSISRYLTVPLGALVVWVVVLRGSYAVVEKVFLLLSLVYITYIISGIIVHPPWMEVVHHSLAPRITFGSEYALLAVALVGTTIAPWQLFYLQASVVDKGLREQELQYERADVFLGSFITDVIAFFIVVATAATLFVHGHHDIADAKDAALALVPFAGASAKTLFVVGLVGASLLACAVIPLSTAYALTEAFGWERGVGRSIRQAPAFFVIFTGLIVLCSGAILVPGLPLTAVTLLTQDVDGLILPAILVFMFVLVNDRRRLGRYANGPLGNIFGSGTLLGVVFLDLVLLASGLPGFPWAHF